MPQELSWIEISRPALFHNTKSIKKLLNPKTLIMAMVKANAYGHGLEIVSPLLAPYVNWFGVNTLSEALALRRLSLKHPILIAAPIPVTDTPIAIKNNISLSCFSLPYLKDLAPYPAKIHLKINTGMNRLGISPAEIPTALSLLSKSSLITVRYFCLPPP